MAIRFYTINNLAANPLSIDDGVVDPPLGPTVDDLVQAVLDHPALKASGPTDITIGGHAGQLITITIPLDVKLPANGQYCLSLDTGHPGSCDIWGWSPGQTFDWYIVDVNGHRLIIDAFHYPGTSQADLQAQRALVNSVHLN
jgi:hypothetical protein